MSNKSLSLVDSEALDQIGENLNSCMAFFAPLPEDKNDPCYFSYTDTEEKTFSFKDLVKNLGKAFCLAKRGFFKNYFNKEDYFNSETEECRFVNDIFYGITLPPYFASGRGIKKFFSDQISAIETDAFSGTEINYIGLYGCSKIYKNAFPETLETLNLDYYYNDYSDSKFCEIDLSGYSENFRPTIYVPESLFNTYQNAECWSKWKDNIIINYHAG